MKKSLFNFNKNFLKDFELLKNKLKNRKEFITIEIIKFFYLEKLKKLILKNLRNMALIIIITLF